MKSARISLNFLENNVSFLSISLFHPLKLNKKNSPPVQPIFCQDQPQVKFQFDIPATELIQ